MLPSNQHTQPRQQAELALQINPTRVDVYYGCQHPPAEDWLRDTIDTAFVHAYRIEIEIWNYPPDDLEVHLTAAERGQAFWDDLAETGAQEER